MTVTEAPRLTMRGIHKRFGSTHALRGVDLELRTGEVHALVGENGAGKSTLMKVLSGAERADAGSMTLVGQPYAPGGPSEARRRGVAMIYQELTLAPHLSVEANMLLGLEPSRCGVLLRREGRRRVCAALETLEHPEIQPEQSVARLSPAAQQLVEIARALLLDVRVLVLDEPTSSLTQEDAGRLFGLMRRLRERGVTIVYISHFLEEVRQVADRFTVLRDGQSVGSGTLRDFAMEHIIELMVGRSLTEQFPRVPHTPGAADSGVDRSGRRPVAARRQPDVAARRNSRHRRHRGAGRTELLRTVFGLDPVRSGRVKVLAAGGMARWGSGPRRRIAQGLGLLSEDRKGEGLALIQSIADNLTYTRLEPYSRGGWLNQRRRRQAVRDWLARLRRALRRAGASSRRAVRR